jgi:hypothetical protein
MEEIAEWLEKLGMSEYAQRFVEHRVTFSALLDFTDADLKDLGVVLGDRRRILRAISRVDAAAAVLVPKPSCTLRASQGSPNTDRSSEQRDMTLHGIAQATEGENPRANYRRLIADTVKGLERSTAEARQVV